jgi:hypothetical protein
MGLGPRTGDPSSATPIAQVVPDDTPRIELTPKPAPSPSMMGDMLRGLRHKLPAFLGGRKRG